MKKRSVERIPLSLEAEFDWSREIRSGSLANISEKGMLLTTGNCPPMRAKFNISLPTDGGLLKVPVRVRRVLKKDNRYTAVGLEVVNPPRQYLDYVYSLRWRHIRDGEIEGHLIRVFVCRTCSHIAFEHAPVNCPICHATIESFEKAPQAIKKPDNSAELSDLEKMHIPKIEISRKDSIINAHVRVGEIEHCMEPDDHIEFIDLYVNGPLVNKKCVSRIHFSCERMEPSTTLRFQDDTEGVLTAISCCSTHGNWMSKAIL